MNFLCKIRSNCKALFILGDLFDYWFDYSTVIPKDFYRIVATLKDMIESGIEIHYIIGNHDFGHYNFFENELKTKIYQNDLDILLDGKKFFLSHGDGKIPNDYGYIILKKILRNKTLQKLYRLIHPDIGIKLARKSSRKSRQYTTKNNWESDPLFEFAKRKIEEGFDFVIMGHIHKSGLFEHKGGIYANLGDWFSEPKFAKFDGNSLNLFDVNKFLLDK